MASSPRIDELRKKFEENPRRYFAPLANEYRKAGDVAQAIAICREHLPQQPGHMSGHIVFGQALFEAKQLDEAKTVFETALSLDPENLIALKHLGDIAVATGDREGAKGWYKRVLEADPRNEETLAQLAVLEGGAAAAPVAAAAPAPESMSTAKTVPIATAASAAPTVVMKAVAPPTKPAAPPAAPAAVPTAVTADSPTAEIRLDGLMRSVPPPTQADEGLVDMPATLIMDAPHGVTPVKAHDAPVVVPTTGLESTSLAAEAPMEAFSLEGLETTSLAPPPPPAPPAATELPELDISMPPASAAAPEIELEMPAPEPAAPAVPHATASADVPVVDLDFGAPAPPAAPEPPPVEAELIDLGQSAPSPTQPPATVAQVEPEEPAAAPAAELVELDVGFAPPAEAARAPMAEPGAPPTAEPAEAPMAELEAPAPAPASGPFVTETMADLYLQQGHRDEALRVYRALLEQRPGDAGLMGKIASLEAPPPEPMALPAATGPSIRAILVFVAQRRPGYRPEPIATNGASPVDAMAVESAPPATERHDALAVLWGNAPPSADEDTAALMLSAAFADLDGDRHGDGILDLGATAPTAAGPAAAVAAVAAGPGEAPAGPPSSFSFDKFFSQRATAEHAASGPAAGTPMESPEDAARFAQWLEGLKHQ